MRVPVRLGGEIELVHNGKHVALSNCWNPFREKGHWPRTVTLEASAFDQRVLLAVDGRLLFDPFDYESRRAIPIVGESPIGLGVDGGELTVSDLKIYRDLHYTGTLANTPRRVTGCDAPVELGPDEYFVLGDNSPVSNRFAFLGGKAGRSRLDVSGQAVPRPSAGGGGPAPSVRAIGLLGSRSSSDSLHSIGQFPLARSAASSEPDAFRERITPDPSLSPRVRMIVRLAGKLRNRPLNRSRSQVRRNRATDRCSTRPREIEEREHATMGRSTAIQPKPAGTIRPSTLPTELRTKEGYRDTIEAVVVAFILGAGGSGIRKPRHS